MYELPKIPREIENQDQENEENYYDSRSVFEEHALIKYLDPDDDPRGRVLAAVYNVKNNVGVDYMEVAIKEFGSKIPKNLLIGVLGEGFHGNVVFPQKEGKSWYELGCKVCAKLQ